MAKLTFKNFALFHVVQQKRSNIGRRLKGEVLEPKFAQQTQFESFLDDFALRLCRQSVLPRPS
jgi:hypothetical protein